MSTTVIAGLDYLSDIPPMSLPSFRKALSNTRWGVSDTIVALVGDSTDIGAWGNGVLTAGNRPNSPAARLAALCQSKLGVPGCNDSFWGAAALDAGHTVAASVAYDTRISAVVSGANEWGFTGIASGQLTSIAERCWANAVGVGALGFAPTDAFDTIDTYYVQASSYGSFTTDIGAAALQTVNCAGSTLFTKATVSTGAAPATGTFNTKRTGTGAISIVGAIARNSLVKKLHVLNWGWYGCKSADQASIAGGVYGPANAMATVNPHIAIIRVGLNDINSLVPPATWQANVQTIITKFQAVKTDVLLCFMTPQNPATRDTGGLTAAYLQAAYQLANSNGVPLLDMSQRFGSYAAMVAQGGWFFDDVHMLIPGYGDIAAAYANALRLAA